jgi:hypothetical protein
VNVSQANNDEGVQQDTSTVLSVESAHARNEQLQEGLDQAVLAARKIDYEVQKLKAEVRQMTEPHKTPQFYFTVCTTLFSAVAAIGAVYGVGLQSHLNKQDMVQAANELKQLKLEKESVEKDLTATKTQKEKLALDNKDTGAKLDRLARLEKSNNEAMAVSAKLAVNLVEFLKKTPGTQSQANEFLDSQAEKWHEYVDLSERLKHESLDVRRFAAQVLSRLNRSKAGPADDCTALADKILAAMVAEKDRETNRSEGAAVARLGKEAIEPLLKYLKKTQGDPRLNVIRTLGDLGDQADDRVRKALIVYLGEKDNDKILLQQTVIALGKFGVASAAAEERMLTLLKDNRAAVLVDADSFSLCQETITSLGKIGVKSPETIDLLIRFFEVDSAKTAFPVNSLRKQLLVAIGRCGSGAKIAVPKIVELIKTEKQGDLLDEAAVTLARLGAHAEIKKLIHSNNPQHVNAALVGLTGMKSDEDRIAFLLELQEVKKMNFLPPSTVLLLKNRGSDAVPVLAAAVDLKINTYARENIAMALGEIGKNDARAVKALIGLLHHTDEKGKKDMYAQMAAIRSLGKVAPGDAAVEEEIAKLFADPATSQQVKAVAQSVAFAASAVEKSFKGVLQTDSPDSPLDPVSNKYYRIHRYKLEQGNTYQIDLMSRSFDAFLYLKKGDLVLAFDDDSGGNLNARLFFEPKQTDEYELWATTYPPDSVGDYTLEIRRLSRKGN